MGGTEWERDNYIAGRYIYIMENKDDSARLMTLICSDSLNQNMDILNDPPQFFIYPYLLVHIQLNHSPYNIDFARYRGEIFSRNLDDKEVLCLNWGRSIKMNNKNNWNEYGGSALFTKSDNLNLQDDRVNNNHAKGLYYTNWKTRKSSAYLFNFDEYIFNIRNTKTSQAEELGVNPGRTGPEIINIKVWNNVANNWEEIKNTEDEFCKLCESIQNEGSFDLITSMSSDPINLERLITLSIGKATEKNWHDVRKNYFFIINDDGINRRITFTQDPCQETKERRKQYLIQFVRLANYIVKHCEFPDTIEDLKGNYTVNYKPNKDNNSYYFNLFSNNNSPPATAIYLGETDNSTAIETSEKIINLFNENLNWARVVVWYRDNKEYKYIPGKRPKYTNNSSKPINSINSNRR